MNKRLLETLKHVGSKIHRAASEKKAGTIDKNPKAYQRHAKHRKRAKEEEIHIDE